MNYQAHRGVETEFPENTLPAFAAAIAQGYDYIEADPSFTADGQCVILHDATLNRTCRHPDGSAIRAPLRISELTYREALQYDAGIAKSYNFRGTTIPLLSELLALAKNAGVTVKLDGKIRFFNEEQTNALFDMVASSGASVAFTSPEPAYIQNVVERFADAEIHYDGYVDEQTIFEVKSLLRQNPLTIWLRLPSPLTYWSDMPAADDRLCNLVKQHAALGLWTLTDRGQLEQARRLGADIIETPGQLKPPRAGRSMTDCHTHTRFSHDSQCPPADSYAAAAANRLAGFAVTDHCDVEYYGERDVLTPILQSVQTAKALDSIGNDLEVFTGIEIGDMLWHKDVADDIVRSADFDIVLGSVHAMRHEPYTKPYSCIDFSTYTEDEIDGLLAAYFQDVAEMAQSCDFDVLTHLTCPLRYICGKYHFHVELTRYMPVIEDILRIIIGRGIALEVNTSCLGSHYSRLMPDIPILSRYKELGGYLITVGSDAHDAKRIAYGFEAARQALLSIGFTDAYYYKRRIPMPYSLEDAGQ